MESSLQQRTFLSVKQDGAWKWPRKPQIELMEVFSGVKVEGKGSDACLCLSSQNS